MPKGQSLPEVYNNFVVEPLEEEQEFRDFYVDRPTPIEEIKERIEISRKNEKYLFLGFKGCGKSTELNRLSNEIDKTKFLIVKYSIRDELDVGDFDFRDFFISMALKIYDIAEREDISLNEDIRKDFEEFAIEITHISEKEIEKNKGLGLSFSRIILGKIGVEVKSREYIRKELEMKISDLIRKILLIKTVSDDIVRTLLFSLTIVEYETKEGRWCDINPVLLPLMEKWKKDLSAKE